LILLDTDVLIDVALDRAPHAAASAELLDRLEVSRRGAFVAWHSISNLYYLVAPQRGAVDTRAFVRELVTFVTVAPTDTESLRFATMLPMDDFEDAMQVAAARACGADIIVSRNVRDYEASPIPAMTPAEALTVIGR